MSATLTSTADLLDARCIRAHDALDADAVARLLPLVPGWSVENGRLCRGFGFKNHHHTMAFVNALAWISHTEDHHPELTVTYKNCVARYDTHSVNAGAGGLSQNDFICAAKASALFDQAQGAA
ncbi:4a-hydroxytetrahydrobiopterin dehydratase [Rugamonas sp.]|uniref:4a-hydroxytetrahydrobiopterin dehydratase n=1 Tax=Rugamonas sp. TaxID=1926287 RepID=UPI0025D5C2A8|nr:4a-hydroxytetrahydrobiopterin dehydratase [Rugamonas sp.]